MAEHIQIGDISPRIQYSGNGLQTTFAYPFPIFADADMQAYVDGTLSTPIVDYTITGAGISSGGTVTFLVAPANGTVITLRRTMALARTSDFQESGEFRARVINNELDTLTALIQQVHDTANRALHVGPTDTALQTQLPDKEARAGQFLAFDAGGDPIAAVGVIDTLAVSPFGATVLGAADAPAARTVLGALAPDGDGSALSGIVTGATVSQKANIALNAFRIAVNGGLSVQNMVDGVVDEFTDETGIDAATSSNETYDAAGDYYHNVGVPVQIAQATGTPIGNMTGNGGLAASFDGATSETMLDCSMLIFSGAPGIGKDWGVGVTKTLSRVKVWSPDSGSEPGFSAGVTDPDITLSVYGSNTGFQLAPVLLQTVGPFVDYTGVMVDTIIADTTTAYRYHWVELSTSGSTAEGARIAEAQFFEPGAAVDMSLQSTASMALVQPVSAFLVLWHEFVDAVTLNTDLKAWASIDGGVSWGQAVLSRAASLTGNQQILTGTADVSTQTGTAVKWKIETLNTKEQRVRGVSEQWS